MFQKHFVFYCLLWFSGELCSAETRFGYVHVPEAGGWLRLHTLPATWIDALLRCELEGGVLASPTTSPLTTAMKKLMTTSQPTANIVLIGKRPSYPWVGDNEDHSEDCQAMTDAGDITDANCTTQNRYFCYKNNAKMESISCGTWDKDYKLDPRTRSCYKFHAAPRTWYAAEMACRAEQAHLAVINSETEREALLELFNEHPSDTLHTDDNGYSYIGFWDSRENGDWQTVFGQTFEEAGFGTWGVGEPNHAFGREFCGALRRDGFLNDYFCDGEVSFICEISPFSAHVDSYTSPQTK